MVQVIVDLDEGELATVEKVKYEEGIKSKEAAIKWLIRRKEKSLKIKAAAEQASKPII
jgi:hypothetical protein